MIFEQLQELLRSIKLPAMADLNELHKNDPTIQKLAFTERLGILAQAEKHHKDQARFKRLVNAAKLKDPTACFENLSYSEHRGFDQAYIASLMSCHWIDCFQHLLITGPTGVGKTWMNCAFAFQAIRSGVPVYYYRLPRLLEAYEIARGDGSLPKFRLKLSKAGLVAIDDFGVKPLTAAGRQDLMELVEDRTGTGSLLVSSQLPLNKWYEYIGDQTLADAIMDRLLYNAHKIEMKGESMRKKLSSVKEGKK